MKKRIISALLCGVLLAGLAGCAGKAQSIPDVLDGAASSSGQEAAVPTESSSDAPADIQSEQPETKAEKEPESTQVPAEEKEASLEQTGEAKSASASPSQASIQKESEPGSAKTSEPARQAETPPAQTAAPEAKPEETEQTPSDPVVQEPEPESTEAEPDFDIGYWVSYAKGYAQSVGLELDSGAVYCWDNPITAGSHCIYLERDITSRLNRYSKDGDITQVWVWAEDRGDGSYDLYIGYA